MCEGHHAGLQRPHKAQFTPYRLSPQNLINFKFCTSEIEYSCGPGLIEKQFKDLN